MPSFFRHGTVLGFLAVVTVLSAASLRTGAQGSVDGCGEWSHVPSPNPHGSARLTDIHAIAPWDAWAVGWYDGPIEGYSDTRWQTLTMHWNGSVWSIVASPSPGPNASTTQVQLAAVSAVSSNDVWAVGGKRDQDAGGYLGTRVLALRWDGFSWQDMRAPWPQNRDGSIYTGASGEELYDVDALPSGEVWAVGRYWREAPNGVITWPGVALRWNGSRFDVFELPMVSPLGRQWATAVAALSEDDVWVVGDGDGTSSALYIWHWDGSSFSQVPGPLGASGALESIVALGPSDVWVGGSESTPLLLHWDGSRFTRFETPAGGKELAAWASDDALTYGIGGWAQWNGSAWSAVPGPTGLGADTPVITSLDTVGPCAVWASGWQYAAGAEATLTLKLEPTGVPGDADGDGVADPADNCPAHHNPGQADCDGDTAGDVCELVAGTASDCNGNSTPDDCESYMDCNGNDVPDECEADCNANSVADACDIGGGASADCDWNGVPDECDVFADCNRNGVADVCDLDGGGSTDSNANGYPDECEALGPGFATVNTIQDVVDLGGAQRMENLPGPDGRISFREALFAVNNTPGPQTVAFNIPPEEWDPTFGDATLRLEDGIFVVSDDETTIDFTTQTAFTGDTNPAGGEVAIYGYEVNAWGGEAILIRADRCTVKGLGRVMQRGYGVRIEGSYNRVIGSTISGPLYAGVYVNGWQTAARGNVIGGTEPGEGNVLSAGNDGVRIDGPAEDNVVVGNHLSGWFSGVSIRAGATGNRIGGLDPGERNVISRAGHYGEEGCPVGEQVSIESAPANLVEGNFIGLTADGSASAGQHGTVGVEVRNSPQTTVQGNAIGGILVVGTNHCSGIRYGDAVRVSGASGWSVIRDNLIGTDESGASPVINHAGVRVVSWPQSGAPPATRIEGNGIAYSETEAIRVGPDVSGVTIRANSIFDNGGLGISLSGTGNAGQTAPSLASALSDDAHLTVAGTLDAAPHSAHALELFASPECDPLGAGEGRTLLGSLSVTTDASGKASFTFIADSFVPAGDVVTATATHLGTGNTSEFSACRSVELGACTGAPGVVRGVGIDADGATVTWTPYGPSVVYDVARGEVSAPGGVIVPFATGLAAPLFSDPALPQAGRGFYYLVRASNACGPGPWR